MGGAVVDHSRLPGGDPLGDAKGFNFPFAFPCRALRVFYLMGAPAGWAAWGACRTSFPLVTRGSTAATPGGVVARVAVVVKVVALVAPKGWGDENSHPQDDSALQSN